MKIADICRLMEAFEKSNMTELKYHGWNSSLELRKAAAGMPGTMNAGETSAEGIAAQFPSMQYGVTVEGIAAQMTEKAAEEAASGPMTEKMAKAEAASAGIAEKETAALSALSEEAARQASLKDITSPLAGVFYKAPEPGAEAFVKEGSHIKKGDTIGLIEAMKMISEIPAPCDGTVREIPAEDGKFVEFKAVIMRVEEE